MPPFGEPPIFSPRDLAVPQENDIFWLKPSMRLPNFKETQTRYNLKRSRLLEDAQTKVKGGNTGGSNAQQKSHIRDLHRILLVELRRQSNGRKVEL